MKKMERDWGWAGAVVVVLLLLGFLGCTHVLEHQPSPAASESDGARSAAVAGGYLGDGATEPPGGMEPAVAALDEPVESQLRVHEIQLAEREGREALILVLSRPPGRVHSFTLSDPSRVVLDIDGPLGVTPTQTYPVADAGIARVRVGAYKNQLRVVADANDIAPDVDVVQNGRLVVAMLGPATDGHQDQLVYRAIGVAPGSPAEPGAPADQPVAVAVASDAPPAESPSAEAASAPAGSPAEREDVHVPPPVEVAVTEPEVRVADAPAPVGGAMAAAAHSSSPPLPEPAVAATSDLVLREPPVEEPAAYALPVQAKSGTRKPVQTASRAVQHSVDGGTVTTRPVREPHEYTGQRISLDFKDADIQNVLRILADVSGLNIITTEEVQGKLTMRLVDVPWDQAFDAILRAKNLDSVREGNIIRVSTVEQLKKERDAQRAADEAQKQVEPLEVRYIKVNYAKADEKLVKKLQEVLSDRGSATWDERTNTIVIRDIASGVVNAEELVSHFDTQTPQILIESNIVEAQKTFLRDLGIQWGFNSKVGPGTGNSTGMNFPGTINGGGVLAGGKNSPATSVPFIADFPAANVAPGAGTAYDILLGSIDGSSTLDARLTALETDGKVKIISRPRVVTLNNLAATIESLRILRVKLPSTGTVISTGAGGVAGSSQNATEQIKTGITLTVTPQVSSDGFIFLDVFAKSSTIAPSSSPDQIPDEVSRQAESHVLIRDGETFVLGGVYQDTLNRTNSGIPYLKNIPVIGWAFKDHVDKDDRQELLVFITPKTVVGRGSTEEFAKLPSAETLWQNRPH